MEFGDKQYGSQNDTTRADSNSQGSRLNQLDSSAKIFVDNN
jgi:hypothetical protein